MGETRVAGTGGLEKRERADGAVVGRHRDRRRCSIHDVNFARVCAGVHPYTIGWNQIDSRLRYTYQSNCQYRKTERDGSRATAVSEERMAGKKG